MSFTLGQRMANESSSVLSSDGGAHYAAAVVGSEATQNEASSPVPMCIFAPEGSTQAAESAVFSVIRFRDALKYLNVERSEGSAQAHQEFVYIRCSFPMGLINHSFKVFHAVCSFS